MPAMEGPRVVGGIQVFLTGYFGDAGVGDRCVGGWRDRYMAT